MRIKFYSDLAVNYLSYKLCEKQRLNKKTVSVPNKAIDITKRKNKQVIYRM